MTSTELGYVRMDLSMAAWRDKHANRDLEAEGQPKVRFKFL